MNSKMLIFSILLTIASCAPMTPQELNKTVKKGMGAADIIALLGKPQKLASQWNGNRTLVYDEYSFNFINDRFSYFTKTNSPYYVNVASGLKSKLNCENYLLSVDDNSKDSLLLENFKTDLEKKLKASGLKIVSSKNQDTCSLNFSFTNDKVKESKIYSTTDYAPSIANSYLGLGYSFLGSSFALNPIQNTSSKTETFYERTLKLTAKLNGKTAWESTIRNATESSDDRKLIPILSITAASVANSDTGGEVRDLIYPSDPRVKDDFVIPQNIHNLYVLNLSTVKKESPFVIAEMLNDTALFKLAIDKKFPLTSSLMDNDPMCIAAKAGYLEGVQLLVKNGASADRSWNKDQKFYTLSDCFKENANLSEEKKQEILDYIASLKK